MALATVEVLAGRAPEERRLILDGVRRALVTALKVPADDPTIRLIEHLPENLIVPPRHSDRYTIISITMFEGRTEATKRRLYAQIVHELGAAAAIPADDVQIVVYEPPLSNWSIGGPPATDTDPGFVIRV